MKSVQETIIKSITDGIKEETKKHAIGKFTDEVLLNFFEIRASLYDKEVVIYNPKTKKKYRIDGLVVDGSYGNSQILLGDEIKDEKNS